MTVPLMISTISFDAGGVLVNPNWKRVAAALREHGVEVEPRALEGAEPLAKRRFDQPETVAVTSDAQRGWLYFNYVLEGVGITPSKATAAALADLQAYHSTTNLWEIVADGARDCLMTLRKQPLKLIVVSNANGRLHALLDRLGLTSYFDAVVDSFVERVEKPDPRLFQLALKRAGAEPGTSLHIGDLYHVDVVGARKAGMQPLLVDTGDLYADADCARVRSVGEVPGFVEREQTPSLRLS